MKKSEQLPGGLVTETLANIYVKQGRPEKAIEAYSQLQLKIPQKKAYFADLIQKIKEENNLS
jgi:pentatricopeptide repeat protein